MLPSFTTVEWAIILGGLVSSATLIFVFLDFYWSHIQTKRSDISIRPSTSRESNHNSSYNKNTVRSPCTLVNDGKRSGVIRAKECDIILYTSGKEYSWSGMQEMDEHQRPFVTIDHLENRSVPANSTIEASVKFGTRNVERLNSSIEDAESIELNVTVDVEDNVGHYQIQYSDEIELV